jgi:hypothetical protein
MSLWLIHKSLGTLLGNRQSSYQQPSRSWKYKTTNRAFPTRRVHQRLAKSRNHYHVEAQCNCRAALQITITGHSIRTWEHRWWLSCTFINWFTYVSSLRTPPPCSKAHAYHGSRMIVDGAFGATRSRPCFCTEPPNVRFVEIQFLGTRWPFV